MAVGLINTGLGEVGFGLQPLNRNSTTNRNTSVSTPITPAKTPTPNFTPMSPTRDYKSTSIETNMGDIDNKINLMKSNLFTIPGITSNIGSSAISAGIPNTNLSQFDESTKSKIREEISQPKQESLGNMQNRVNKGEDQSHMLQGLMGIKEDIDSGLDMESVVNLYPDMGEPDIVRGIYEDIKDNGLKFTDIIRLYPELSNVKAQKYTNLDEQNTIGNTGISVNPIKQAGDKILELKEYLKKNPKGADPVIKTLIEGVVSQFDPTGGVASKAIMNTDKVSNMLPGSDNSVTQAGLGFAGNSLRGVGQVIEGGAGLVDKGIAGTQAGLQGGNIEQYKTRASGVGENVLDIGAGTTQTLASVYAMPASLLIGTAIETLPEGGQKAVAESLSWIGDKVAKTPGLSQWMESLPENRREEFKQELASAAIGLIIGLKGKGNIIKNPKQFIKENLNPTEIARNFNENVVGLPGKGLELMKSGAGLKNDITDGGLKNTTNGILATKGMKPTYADTTLNEIHGFTKPEIRKFRDKYGIEPGQDLNNRGIINGGDDTIDKITEDFVNLKNEKSQAISQVKQKVPVNNDVTAMVRENANYMKKSAAPSDLPEVTKKWNDLINKAERGELTHKELEEIKSNFQRTQTLNYDYKSKTPSDRVQKLSNIDDNVRKFQQQELDNAGFTNIKDINLDISKNYELLKHFSKDVGKTSGLSFPDYVLLAESAVNPSTLGLFVAKKVGQSNWFKRGLIKASNIINNRGTMSEKIADIDKIKQISNEEEFNQFLKEGELKYPALPSKQMVGEKINTIIAPGKTIVATPNGNVRKGQVLEINPTRNANNTTNSNNTILGVQNKGLKNTAITESKGLVANDKLSDNTSKGLKVEKKSVQSDTLVSKSDEMEADILANMQYAKEDIISNIQSIAKKNPEVIRKVLQKEGNIPDNKIESFIDDASNGKISERQAININNALGKTDDVKPSISKDIQPLYDEAKKYKTAEEFAKGLKNKDDVKAKILMDGFNERYKNRSFEDMLPKGIEYTPDQLSFLRSKVEPNMQLSLQDAKSLMNNEKSILDKINKKMGIDMTRSKEKGEIFDLQLRKIREEANKSPGLSNLKNKIIPQPKGIKPSISKDLQPLYDDFIKQKDYSKWNEKYGKDTSYLFTRSGLDSDSYLLGRIAYGDIPSYPKSVVNKFDDIAKYKTKSEFIDKFKTDNDLKEYLGITEPELKDIQGGPGGWIGSIDNLWKAIHKGNLKKIREEATKANK